MGRPLAPMPLRRHGGQAGQPDQLVTLGEAVELSPDEQFRHVLHTCRRRGRRAGRVSSWNTSARGKPWHRRIRCLLQPGACWTLFNRRVNRTDERRRPPAGHADVVTTAEIAATLRRARRRPAQPRCRERASAATSRSASCRCRRTPWGCGWATAHGAAPGSPPPTPRSSTYVEADGFVVTPSAGRSATPVSCQPPQLADRECLVCGRRFAPAVERADLRRDAAQDVVVAATDARRRRSARLRRVTAGRPGHAAARRAIVRHGRSSGCCGGRSLWATSTSRPRICGRRSAAPGVARRPARHRRHGRPDRQRAVHASTSRALAETSSSWWSAWATAAR